MTALPFEFDGVVRFTRAGVAYLAFTLIVGVSALNTGNNSLYIGLAFMLGALLFSGIASKGALKKIHVEIEYVGEAWAGEEARGVLVVKNRSWIWNVRDLVVTSPSFHRPLLLSELRRGEERRVNADLFFERRGRARIERVDLYTRYPFGIFLKKRRIAVHGNALVYPRLLEQIDAPAAFARLLGEETPLERIGQGSDVFAFREYVRGDSLRQVHWKKSASLGRWIIRQPQSDAGHTIAVVIDPVIPLSASEDDFERMISAATTLIHEAFAQDFEVMLYAGAVELAANNDRGAHEMYEVLALIEPVRERIYLNVPRGAVIFSLVHGSEGVADA